MVKNKTHSNALAALKKKIQEDDSFSKTFDHFFNLAEDSDFMALGKSGKSPILKKAVRIAGESIFSKKVSITHIGIQYLKKQHFYHGALQIDGHLSSVIYFDDIKTGLLSISMPEDDNNVHIMRFTAVVIGRDKTILLNQSNLTH